MRGDDGPAVQHEQQQQVTQVAVPREGVHVEGLEHHLQQQRGGRPVNRPVGSSPGSGKGMMGSFSGPEALTGYARPNGSTVAVTLGPLQEIVSWLPELEPG